MSLVALLEILAQNGVKTKARKPFPLSPMIGAT
jgi:hypothetical protein